MAALEKQTHKHDSNLGHPWRILMHIYISNLYTVYTLYLCVRVSRWTEDLYLFFLVSLLKSKLPVTRQEE